MCKVIMYQEAGSNEPVVELRPISNRIYLLAFQVTDISFCKHLEKAHKRRLSGKSRKQKRNWQTIEKGMSNVDKIKPRARNWQEVRKELFTPKEIAESDIRTALIGELAKTRKEMGLTQRDLEERSGVRQPVIARIENGSATPNLDTILKILIPLGKTLYIGDIGQQQKSIESARVD